MDTPEHRRLTEAMAKLVAHRAQIAKHRKALRGHASAKLDASNHAVAVASDAMRREDNPLVFRYGRTRMTENQRLRALALRGEGEDDRDGDG